MHIAQATSVGCAKQFASGNSFKNFQVPNEGMNRQICKLSALSREGQQVLPLAMELIWLCTSSDESPDVQL